MIPWQVVTVVFVLVVAVLLIAAYQAAYWRGKYQAEVGRREAAERLVTYGTPHAAPAQQLPTKPDSEEVARDIGKGYTEETVQRGMEQLGAEYAKVGRVVTPELLRAEVEAMLYQDVPFGESMG